MVKSKVKKPLKLAKLKCIKTVIIHGRNDNGEPDRCFLQGKEYLFCYDEKKGEIFIHNEVKEVHFLSLNDYYTDKHFEVMTIGEAAIFKLDEFSLNRMARLYKERYDFTD